MATTERASYRFTVKEHGPGETWIALDPIDGSLARLDAGGFLGLDLKPGTDIDEAHRIADFLNENIVAVSHTTF